MHDLVVVGQDAVGGDRRGEPHVPDGLLLHDLDPAAAQRGIIERGRADQPSGIELDQRPAPPVALRGRP